MSHYMIKTYKKENTNICLIYVSKHITNKKNDRNIHIDYNPHFCTWSCDLNWYWSHLLMVAYINIQGKKKLLLFACLPSLSLVISSILWLRSFTGIRARLFRIPTETEDHPRHPASKMKQLWDFRHSCQETVDVGLPRPQPEVTLICLYLFEGESIRSFYPVCSSRES